MSLDRKAASPYSLPYERSDAMSTRFMHNVQRSAGAAVWALPEGTSTTLEVGPAPRVLQVIEGKLWLTTPGTADDAALDLWLTPGESVELDAGAEVVMEGWPAARFTLLVPPAACRNESWGARVASRARALIATSGPRTATALA
jgi:hypothetical protein